MLPSPAEFRRLANRRAGRAALLVAAIAFSLLLLGVTALELSALPDASKWPLTLALGFGTPLGVTALVVLAFLFAYHRHPHTRCPHCRKSLVWHIPVVVSSHHCPHCGGAVLRSPEPLPPEALIPRSDYLAADTAYQKVGVPVLLGGVAFSYLGVLIACGAAGAVRLPDPWRFVAFGAVVLVPPLALVSVMRWVVAWGKRTPGLACPACGKLLAAQRMLVAGTRCCTWCGVTVISPRVRPLPPPHLGPLWELAALKRRRNERRRAMWKHWWVPLGFVVVLTAGATVGQTPDFRRWEREMLAPGVVAAVGVLTVIVGSWLNRRAVRRYPLLCPRCGREFHTGFAVASGCCNRCGWGIVVCTRPETSTGRSQLFHPAP